jgi:hypothetical protein
METQTLTKAMRTNSNVCEFIIQQSFEEGSSSLKISQLLHKSFHHTNHFVRPVKNTKK